MHGQNVNVLGDYTLCFMVIINNTGTINNQAPSSIDMAVSGHLLPNGAKGLADSHVTLIFQTSVIPGKNLTYFSLN